MYEEQQQQLSMSRVNLTRLGSMFGLLLYSIIGAAIFLALEMPEQQRRWVSRRMVLEHKFV
jgi:hypothetical protein